MKRLSRTKLYYLLQTTILTMVLVVLEWAFFLFFPQYAFSTYPLIPIFFFFIGLVMINAFDAMRQKNKNSVTSVFVIRGIRIVSSLIAMVIIAFVDHEGVRSFLLTFAANYFVYLIYDCWFFTAFDLGRKRKINNK